MRGASVPRLASCDLGERAEGAEGIARLQPSDSILQSLTPIFYYLTALEVGVLRVAFLFK